MNNGLLDKTILSLLTVLIAGAGLFAVITKFDVPQLRYSYFGENPYAIKRDVIENVMTWIFTIFALLGLLIEVYSLIFGDKIHERLYSATVYMKFFIIGLFCTILLLFFLGTIGRFIAKKIWRPKIIVSQYEGFRLAESIIKNGGYYNEQLDKLNQFPDEQKNQIQNQNYHQCDEIFSNIITLLEKSKIEKLSREEKYNVLKKYFSSNQ